MKQIELPDHISNRVAVYDQEITNNTMIKIDFAKKKKRHEVVEGDFIASIYGRKTMPYFYNWRFRDFYSIGFFAADENGERVNATNHAILPSDYAEIYSLLGDLKALKSLLIKLSKRTLTKFDINAYNIDTKPDKPAIKIKTKSKPKTAKKVKIDDRQLDMFEVAL